MKERLEHVHDGEHRGALLRAWDWSGSYAAYRMVQAVVLLTAVVAVYLTFEQAQQVRCGADYNAASAEYDRSRASAAGDDRTALRAFVEAAIADDATPEKTKAAGRAYLEQLDRSDRERAASPVVPPPADFCT